MTAFFLTASALLRFRLIIASSNVLLEGWVVFVDGVVSKVHEKTVHIVAFRLDVWFSCKPCYSFFMNENSEWIDSIKQSVNAQVILEVIDQMRFFNILLHNITSFDGALLDDSFNISRQINPLTLRKSFWFHDIRSFSVWVFLDLSLVVVSEFGSFMRNYPCFRKKVIIIRKSSLHFH